MNQPKTSKAEATKIPMFSLAMSLLHDADQLQEQSFYSMARRLRAAAQELEALNAVAESAEKHQESQPGEELENWARVQDALAALADIRKHNGAA